MLDLPETLEVETGAAPAASVIWLHGLGADGYDFKPVVPLLSLPPALSLRFVFPHAPIRAVTINMGMKMRAWYDILQLGGGREDEEGIRSSQLLLEGLVAREESRGIDPGKIVLAGFSQGGAIALQTALRHPKRLAGILALSTYLPLAGTLADERARANFDTPIFMAHGTHDDLIAISRAEASRDALKAIGYHIEWHGYPMGHEVCPEEIAAVGVWLTKVLAA
ncbi:MAG: alpha/beta hydrolase [Betaproteobacteria bacterium]|jgi:phospholipase/carboxylesterase|nr:alpha/beta hydrolase [Betaproteobacteria bacterium]